MKKALSTLFALLTLAAAPMLAGKRIVTESTDLNTKKVTTQQVLIEATRMKVDTDESAVMFLTAGGNRLVMLDKKRNEYTVMDQAAMDKMGQQMNSAMAQMEAAMKGLPPEQRAMMEQMMKGKMGALTGAATPAPTTYQAKGQGKANGFTCTNYEGSQAGQKVSEICAAAPSAIQLSAADFQVMEKMREFMASLTSSMSAFANMSSSSGMTEKGVNGIPVQTTRFRNGKAVSREDLKSVTDATFSDADFSTGKAKQRQLPTAGK